MTAIDTRARYRVTFDRLGQRRDVAPLDVVAATTGDLIAPILAAVRPHIRSKSVRVVLNPAGVGSGFVVAGTARIAGELTVERLEGE